MSGIWNPDVRVGACDTSSRNFQRGIVGLAMAHIEPSGLPVAFGGASNRSEIVPESTEVAIIVIVVWLVFWTVIDARHMMRRDA